MRWMPCRRGLSTPRQMRGWVGEMLKGDVVVGNLERPFAERRRPERLRPGPYRLAADPALASRLQGFTALSLANNHALDAGPAGLVESLRTLRERGIAAVGV